MLLMLMYLVRALYAVMAGLIMNLMAGSRSSKRHRSERSHVGCHGGLGQVKGIMILMGRPMVSRT